VTRLVEAGIVTVRKLGLESFQAGILWVYTVPVGSTMGEISQNEPELKLLIHEEQYMLLVAKGLPYLQKLGLEPTLSVTLILYCVLLPVKKLTTKMKRFSPFAKGPTLTICFCPVLAFCKS
jgi:hypothetical protein